MRIFFDVDGTLIDHNDNEKVNVIYLLCELAFSPSNNQVFVGSGGGVDYARGVCQRLGIEGHVTIVPKLRDPKNLYDIAFDDERDAAMGKVNLWVR